MKGSILAFFLILPGLLHASAVKECRVEAVVEKVAGTKDKPVLTIKVKSAVFERGHSMDEDCSLLEGPGAQTIELQEPAGTAPGQKILLTFRDVRNATPSGPFMSQTWHVHPDNGKSK